MAARASGPGGESTLAKYPSFEPLRLLLAATKSVQAPVLNDAAKALAAGKSYGIYDVILTNEQLYRPDCLPEISRLIVFNGSSRRAPQRLTCLRYEG